MDPFVINRCGSYAGPRGEARCSGARRGETERARDLQRGMDRFKTADRESRRPLIDTSPLIITSFPASCVAARAHARDKSSRLVPTQERMLLREKEREGECVCRSARERGRERRRETGSQEQVTKDKRAKKTESKRDETP